MALNGTVNFGITVIVGNLFTAKLIQLERDYMAHKNHRRKNEEHPKALSDFRKGSRNESHCDATSRAGWKRLTSRSARRRDKAYENEQIPRASGGVSAYRLPKNRK